MLITITDIDKQAWRHGETSLSSGAKVIFTQEAKQSLTLSDIKGMASL